MATPEGFDILSGDNGLAKSGSPEDSRGVPPALANPHPLVANREGEETCPDCGGIGAVCLACKSPIDECECFEDSEPCICERCDGRGA